MNLNIVEDDLFLCTAKQGSLYSRIHINASTIVVIQEATMVQKAIKTLVTKFSVNNIQKTLSTYQGEGSGDPSTVLEFHPGEKADIIPTQSFQ